MDVLGQSALVVSVTSLSLGLSVLARNVRNKLYLAFALVTTLVSAWALFFFLEKLWGGGHYYRFHLLTNVWLAPAAIALIRLLIRIQDPWSRWMERVSIGVAVILSGVLLIGLDLHSVELTQAVYFAPALIVLQLLQLMWIDFSLKRGVARLNKPPTVGFARRSLIYIGALGTLSFSVMDHVPWMGSLYPVFGNLVLTIYLFFLSQAITQQRLLNFWAIFSRFLVLLVLALTLTAVYSLLFAFIADKPALFLLNSFIISFLIVMLLEPIRKMVSYFTQRLLSQRHRKLEDLVRQGQRLLVTIVDVDGLVDVIEHILVETLQPHSFVVYLLDSSGTRYRRLGTRKSLVTPDEANDAPLEILARHSLLEYCSKLALRGELPMLLDQILANEVDRSTSRVRREELVALEEGLRVLGGNLLIPFLDAEQILGFVIVAVQSPPEPWGGNWGLLPLIYPYFEQVGATLRSLEVYVKSREKDRLAAIGEMAAGLAHEIRNPLGAIKGAAQLLQGNDDDSSKRFLAVILEETDRLNRVVSQFLDYSKPPSAERVRIDLVQLVKNTYDLMRASIPQQIDCKLILPHQPVWVRGAPEQLKQVVINLILNSMRALAHEAQPRIKIELNEQSQGEPSVALLSVEDNGHGIALENIKKLFIPFYTTSPSGTGLGLSISHKIVEAHQGRIEVSTEVGHFARFTVVLPRTDQ